ncbi:hypothetical protein FPV67DRAFT_1670313 [Lyophyllum atratum]|nr:hypothetical protein FPV67DRAFT_1670313 [Lyophyllum atratum]
MVACSCSKCGGRLVTQRELQQHRERDMRRASATRPAVQPGARKVVTFATASQKRATPPAPPHRSFDPLMLDGAPIGLDGALSFADTSQSKVEPVPHDAATAPPLGESLPPAPVSSSSPPTSKYPNGRRVRVALVAVVCDKPAAHKLGGFGSHAHTYFCTKCWVTQELKATDASFTENGFRARTDSEHRGLQEDYLMCKTKTARAEFVKAHATRWSELYRLPYFDICRMIMIDPMHNLLLGVVKTHFYHIWVQNNILRKTKELRRLHAILAELKMPAKLGRLPSLIGEPAGGSLTADQWLVFVTVVAPLAVPQIWEDYFTDSQPDIVAHRTSEITAANAKKRVAAAAARQKRLATQPQTQPLTRPQRMRKQTARAQAMDIDPEDDNYAEAGTLNDAGDETFGSGPSAGQSSGQKRRHKTTAEIAAEDEQYDSLVPSQLSRDDPPNFLKLCVAIQLLLARTITEEDLVKADALLREYCWELVKLYGPSVIRPNHHYAVHTAASVRDYGPLHEFWTFLFERLNKVLKSYKTNNHAGGELETSFFREFHRTVQDSRLLAQAAHSPDHELRQVAAAMYRASADDGGTVQALAQDLDAAQEDGGVAFRLSNRAETASPGTIHSHIALPPSPQSCALQSVATFFDYVVIDQNQYLSSRRTGSVADSLIAASFFDGQQYRLWVGELLDILVVNQPAIGQHRFGYVRWYVPCNISLVGTAWENFSSARVQLWHVDSFLRQGDIGPAPLIPLESIVCYAIRSTAEIRGDKVWVTVL